MLTNYAKLGYLAVAALVAPALPLAAADHSCPAAAPTEQSYTWNFKAEASGLLAAVQQEASDVVDRADELQNFALDTGISWQSHASDLDFVKDTLNDMGAKLCRLQAISPEMTDVQRRALETALPLASLMARDTTDAMKFLNAHVGDFWMARYRNYVNNLYNQSLKLDKAVKEYREYARLRNKEQRLQSELGLKARS